MLVDHIVPNVENPSSGVAQCVCGLCNGLVSAGADVNLHSLIGCHPAVTLMIAEARAKGTWNDNRAVLYRDITYPCCRLPFPEFGRSPEMLRGLKSAVQRTDVLHTHGMWMLANIYPYWALGRHERPLLVTSPHGVLTEYALRQSRWKKRIMWAIGQKAQLKRTNLFHVTSQGEYEDVRRLGFRQPVAVVRFGIDMPEVVVKPRESNRKRTLMYLSRIHPDKRLDLLLDAWQGLETQFKEWKLDIYGPLAGEYPRQMMARSQSLGLKNVTFKGEILGTDKMKAYVDADLFILPTHTENFGLVVAEALACGTPAIVTKGAPWAGLETRKCGWWIEESVASVRDCLQAAMSLPDEARWEMGGRGRSWMTLEFSWTKCGRQMLAVYEWLQRGGPMPDCVSTL